MTCPLTENELECVRLLAIGKTYEEQAIILDLSRVAVMSRLDDARRKANVHKSTDSSPRHYGKDGSNDPPHPMERLKHQLWTGV